MHFVLTFICLYFVLLDIGVLSSLKELCIMQVAAINFICQSADPPSLQDSVYIVLCRQTVQLYHDSTVWLNFKIY